MLGRSIRIGRLFGVEFRLDYSWLFIFVLVTWLLAARHFPMMNPGWSVPTYWFVGLATSVLFFASVLAHELGHSLVSQALGVPVRDITLFIFGGAASLSREPERPRDELAIAVVGPVTSLALGGAFWVLARLTASSVGPVPAVAAWLAWINVSLGVFNLLPGFPLDGGRVLRAILWAATGKLRRATRIAAIVGRVVAFGFIFWGVWQFFAGYGASGLWIAFIGWFLDSAAAETYRQVGLEDVLAGHTVRDATMADCPRLSPEQTIDAMVDQVLLPSGRRCFPVMDDGQLVGLLTLHGIKTVPRARWPVTRVADVMIDRNTLHVVRPDDPLADVLDRMTNEDINQFPVMEDGRFVGMIARDRLLDLIRTRSELGA